MNFSTTKYKVKIRKISGLSDRILLDSHQSAYLGISMNNPLFGHPSFQCSIDWMEAKFPNNYLLLGDYLNRWNELIFRERNEAIAQEKSLQQGHDFRQKLIENFKLSSPETQILHWLPLITSEGFEPCLHAVGQAYEANAEFRASLDVSAQKFIEKQLTTNTLAVSHAEALRLSHHYLIEELAVFTLLAQQGIPVQIYPGTQLPILEAVAKISPNFIPKELIESIFVEIKLKKL